jgi:hypothetical protein
MLKYALCKSYLLFLGSLDKKDKGAVLWMSQNILSHCPGYLAHRVKSLSEEESVYKVGDDIYLRVYDDYALRVMQSGEKGSFEHLSSFKEEPVVAVSIVALLKEISKQYNDELTNFFTANYFTGWFAGLFDRLKLEDRDCLLHKTIAPQIEMKKVETPLSPVIVQSATPIKPKLNTPKKDVDGEEYEKAILLELQKSYALRKAVRTKEPVKPLQHVKFAKQEIVVSYDNEDEAMGIILKRTRKFGLRLSSNNWLIILANTVEESFADCLKEEYPDHVVYSDKPNKGDLDYAIIVKVNRDKKPEEIQGIKRVKSKTASFTKEIPEGAFENIDEEEQMEEENKSKNSFRLVKSKEASFEPQIKVENLIEDGDDFNEDFVDLDDDDLDEKPEEKDTTNISRDEYNEPVPKFWHCYLCGKKKVYTGEPAETITLRDGSTAYLCKKHRGKY